MNPAPELRYIALRTALNRYQKALPDLSDAELAEISTMAASEYRLQSRILQAPPAAGCVVEDSRLQQAVAEIRGRYDNEADFSADLARNGLDPTALARALRRELQVEAVLEKVAAQAEPVTDAEVESFYQHHPEHFILPETRTARHILITINPDYAENTRAAARERITTVATALGQNSANFAELAQQHSECPTAVHGGLLGRVRPGQLYAALDQALFHLAAGELSEILESEIGFHILTCDTIHPAEHADLTQAAPKIRARLRQHRGQQHQKAWLTALHVADEEN